MAFDFLGTIESIEQFEEFEEFVNIEMTNMGQKINHLNAEVSRLNILLDKFKTADLKLRAGSKKSNPPDANWIIKPRPIENRHVVYLDGLNALDVDNLKKATLDQIKFKRERNEFKIKRIRDLMEQYNNEITFLTTRQSDYTNLIEKIRARFDISDFTEVQKIKAVDPIDVDPTLRALPKNAGKVIIGDQTYYKVLSINEGQNSITFDYSAPPVAQGESLILSGGKNDGTKTVLEYRDARTIIILETVVTENPSTTRVQIK